jgi:hypothetical protein
MDEVFVKFTGKILINRDGGDFESFEFPVKMGELYARAQQLSPRRAAVMHTVRAMMHDLGQFVAGRRDPEWIDNGIDLDAPGWVDALGEAIADALGVVDPPEVSPGPLDPPIRIP